MGRDRFPNYEKEIAGINRFDLDGLDIDPEDLAHIKKMFAEQMQDWAEQEQRKQAAYAEAEIQKKMSRIKAEDLITAAQKKYDQNQLSAEDLADLVTIATNKGHSASALHDVFEDWVEETKKYLPDLPDKPQVYEEKIELPDDMDLNDLPIFDWDSQKFPMRPRKGTNSTFELDIKAFGAKIEEIDIPNKFIMKNIHTKNLVVFNRNTDMDTNFFYEGAVKMTINGKSEIKRIYVYLFSNPYGLAIK